MTEHPNTGRKPRLSNPGIPLGIRWMNGSVSKWTYLRDQLVWELRGWDFDVKSFWKA